MWAQCPSVTVSTLCSTLYVERLRRHGRNEGSLCALVLHLCMCRLLRGSGARCRWAQRRGSEGGLGGERRSCLANCRPWRLKRRRHCRHGNPTEKSLRSGCCLAAATAVTEVICVWRVTSIVRHLNLEQAVVGGGIGYGGNKELKEEEDRMREKLLLLL